MKLRLSDAQVSAIECRDWSEEPGMQRAWQGSHLVFEAGDREALWLELNDASNAEDAQAQHDSDATARKFAGRASRSLACVAGKGVVGMKAERETCHVADSACLAPAGRGNGVGYIENTTAYVKAHCVLCVEPVCRNCSSVRVCEAGRSGCCPINGGKKGRVCNNCQIRYLDGGDNSRVMARMRRLVDG